MSMDEATRRALAALADGSLQPGARDELLRRIDASPELEDALAGQHAARAEVLAAEGSASASLRATVAAMAAEASRRHGAAGDPRLNRGRPSGRRRRTAGGARGRSALARLRPAFVALSAGAAACAAAAVLLFAGGGPSVADAAQVALAPASGAAPGVRPGERLLTASVDGVAYPYWADSTGWQAVGSRRDAVDGRPITTVYYANARGQRLGYAIAAGSPLAVHDGATVVRGGIRYRVLDDNGAAVVTWLRDGHTCILAARGVDASVLLMLASWQSH